VSERENLSKVVEGQNLRIQATEVELKSNQGRNEHEKK